MAWRNSIYRKGQAIALLIGNERTETEIRECQGILIDITPLEAVLITPSEVQSPDDLPKLWRRVARLGGFVFGDVIASPWNLFVWGGHRSYGFE